MFQDFYGIAPEVFLMQRIELARVGVIDKADVEFGSFQGADAQAIGILESEYFKTTFITLKQSESWNRNILKLLL
jgi:hypothetical protein